jgi:predicted NBD/HSP70 family sugar kinase
MRCDLLIDTGQSQAQAKTMGIHDKHYAGSAGRPAGALPLSRRGTSQSGMRAYNERLVLSLIRTHGSLPKAEIARLTGLSAQAISVIVRQLEADQLVIKGASVRGRVGQPSQPYLLNPDGAFAIGLKVGRRSCNLIAIDFCGNVRSRHDEVYNYPTPPQVLAIARAGLARIKSELGPRHSKRISGIGIASPFELWNWEQEVGAPHQAMESWRGVDIAAEIAALCPWPVQYCNDATAATAAELFFGQGRKLRDFLGLYVGFFVGGGVVLGGSLFPGRTGYAGALGPLPVPAGKATEQLIRHASLYILENMVAAKGMDPLMLTRNPDSWEGLGDVLDQWIESTARSLAHAALSAASIIDFEAVIIDGTLPPHVRRRLVEETRSFYQQLDSRGIAPLAILEGSIGRDARALGAASLPIFASFMTDRDVLFKEPAEHAKA